MGRFRAVNSASLTGLRVLRANSGRLQTRPQQYSVTSSCSGRVKSSVFPIDFFTYSAPSTSPRTTKPFSKISCLIYLSHSFINQESLVLYSRGGVVVGTTWEFFPVGPEIQAPE